MVLDPDSDGDGFNAKEWPFFWLTRATGLYLSRLEKGLKKANLDIPRWRVLMCVHPGAACSVSEIADLAIVKLPTMMKLIQRMEAEGLVKCEARINDGRVTDVSLTQAGIEARKRAWGTAGKIYSHVFADVDNDNLDRLNDLLRMVVSELEAEA